MKRAAVVTGVLLATVLGVCGTAGAKPAPLKSCIAALDAAESTGTKGDLYIINARRCRQGINSAETAVATKAGPYTPVPTDFGIEILTLEQSCFGSAGCNVTYQIKVTYLGAQLPASGQTFIVSYDLLGGEDPEVGSFTIRDGTVTSSSRELIQTPPNPALSAVPKQVVKGS